MKTTLFKSFMTLVACLFVSTAWAQSEGDEVTYDIPTPATIVEKDLNVVGTSEVLVEQYARADYTADALELDINEVMTKLGIASLEEFAAILPDILYCTEYFMGDEAYPGGPKLDTLSNYFTANAPGFWMRPVLDEDENETGELASAPYGTTDKFYAEAFAINAETGILTFNVGQYPGQLLGGENYFANMYIIYGDKAWRLHFTFNVVKIEAGSLADYNKVGEETKTVEQEPTTNYMATGVPVDINAIAAELGCEVADIKLFALVESGEFATKTTANNGGYWFNADGKVVDWGQGSVIFIEPAAANDFSVFNVGQYPSALGAGDSSSATLYFIGGENYYALTITMQVINPQPIDTEFKIVDERGLVALTLARGSGDYTCDQYPQIPLTTIEEILGTTSPKLYGLATDENAEATGSPYSDKYSCDPNPGFWLNAEGRVSTWGDSNARVGVSYLADGTFQLFQYPDRNAVGDVFTTQLFLANPTTSDMMKINLTVKFVSEIEEVEVVGSQDVVIPVGADNVEVVFDLAPAAEKLGVTVEELLDEENACLRGFTKAGVYGEAQPASTGLGFDIDGGFNPYGSIYFIIELDAIRNEILMTTVSDVEIPEDFNVPAQFCIQVEGKQYVYNAHLVSESVYVGIDEVKKAKADKSVFDLSGRRVEKATRGVYIQNGKKVIK